MNDTNTPTFEQIQALRKPRTDTVAIPLDGELLDQIAALEAEVEYAQRRDARRGDSLAHVEAEAPALQAELDALRQEAADAAVEFVFRALPRRLYRKLVVLFPADKDNAEADAFTPALIAASCVQPVLTSVPHDEFLERLEKAEDGVDVLPYIGPAMTVWNDWSTAQATALSGLALVVNTGRQTVPTGARSSNVAAGSEPNSTSAASTD